MPPSPSELFYLVIEGSNERFINKDGRGYEQPYVAIHRVARDRLQIVSERPLKSGGRWVLISVEEYDEIYGAAVDSQAKRLRDEIRTLTSRLLALEGLLAVPAV